MAMAKRPPISFLTVPWICRQCKSRSSAPSPFKLPYRQPKKNLSTNRVLATDVQIQAAPEIDFVSSSIGKLEPARIIPASPSYFTASPIFNDHLLRLRALVLKNGYLPVVPPENTPRFIFMRLSQFRGIVGEKVAAAKYAQILILLNRLNRIHPTLRPAEVISALKEFERPGSAVPQQAKPGVIDEFGRSKGVGRRKESTAKVYLVEGTGEVLVNGKNLVQAFPRLHDRESALWALKVTERMDKYNVFALTSGGGLTGQAESITLALARALMVHEPALKPALRRAGCVTVDARRVERKKPGRLKARKRPAWVKR